MGIPPPSEPSAIRDRTNRRLKGQMCRGTANQLWQRTIFLTSRQAQVAQSAPLVDASVCAAGARAGQKLTQTLGSRTVRGPLGRVKKVASIGSFRFQFLPVPSPFVNPRMSSSVSTTLSQVPLNPGLHGSYPPSASPRCHALHSGRSSCNPPSG